MCVQSAAMCMILQKAILTQVLLRELHSRIFQMIGYALYAVSAKTHLRHSKKIRLLNRRRIFLLCINYRYCILQYRVCPIYLIKFFARIACNIWVILLRKKAELSFNLIHIVGL